MSTSSRRVRRTSRVKRSVIAALIIATMVCPLTPSQAEVSGTRVRRLLDSAVDLLRKSGKSPRASDTRLKPRQIETQAQREDRVTHVKLCPRRRLKLREAE